LPEKYSKLIEDAMLGDGEEQLALVGAQGVQLTPKASKRSRKRMIAFKT